MKTFSLISALTAVSLLAFAPGCSDDEATNSTNSTSSSSSGQGGASTSSSSTGVGGSGGFGGTSSSSTGEGGAGGAGGSTTGTGGAGGAGGTGGAIEITSCGDVGKSECFTNYDCTNTTERCENIGTTALQVACCVPGARGTKTIGQACTSENDCASAVCLENFCTESCTSNDDCSGGLPVCNPILGACVPAT